MYSLNCDYFVEEFSSLEKLLYYANESRNGSEL
jgi:hypothetical protein